jgi:hypothetical protein
MAYELTTSGPITAAEAKRQHKRIVASMAGDLRKKDRRILKELRERLKAKRAEKKKRLDEIRALCRQGKVDARARAKERAAELVLRQKAEREAAKEQKRAERAAACATCETKATVKAEATAEVQTAKETLEAERARVKREHESSYHKPPTRTRAEAARERAEAKAQSDDEVRNDIPVELVPVWEKVKHDPAMKATARSTRTEVFLDWVHNNSADVMHLIDVSLHEDLEKLEREEKEHAKAIGKKDRYTRSPAHLAVDLDVNEDEYRKGWENAQKEIERDKWNEETARRYLENIEPGASDFARGFDDALRRVAGVKAINTTRVLGTSEGPYQTPNDYQIKGYLRNVASADRLFVVAIRVLGDAESYSTIIVDAADASEAERAAVEAVESRHGGDWRFEVVSVWSPEVTNPDDWPGRPVDPLVEGASRAHAREEAAAKAKARSRSLSSIFDDDDDTLRERLANPDSAKERSLVAKEIERRARARGMPPIGASDSARELLAEATALREVLSGEAPERSMAAPKAKRGRRSAGEASADELSVPLTKVQQSALEIYVFDPAHEGEPFPGRRKGSTLFIEKAQIERAFEILTDASNSAGDEDDRAAKKQGAALHELLVAVRRAFEGAEKKAPEASGETYEAALAEMQSQAHGEKALNAARTLVFAVHDGLPFGPTRKRLETEFKAAIEAHAKRTGAGGPRVIDKLSNHTPSEGEIKRYLREVPAHRLWVVAIESRASDSKKAPRLVTVIAEAETSLQAERLAREAVEKAYQLGAFAWEVVSVWSPEVTEPGDWPGRPRDHAAEWAKYEKERDEADREIKRRGIVEVDEDQEVLRRSAREEKKKTERRTVGGVPFIFNHKPGRGYHVWYASMGGTDVPSGIGPRPPRGGVWWPTLDEAIAAAEEIAADPHSRRFAGTSTREEAPASAPPRRPRAPARDLRSDEILELAFLEANARAHGERAIEAAEALVSAVDGGLPPGPSRTVLEQRFLTALRAHQKANPTTEQEAPF